jgi:hypothetical protein
MPHCPGGYDVEHGKLVQSPGVIERQAIRDPATAVMTGDEEVHVSLRLHDLNHGVCHCPLGVGGVLRVGLRRIRPAVTGQVGNEELEMARERRRHAMPHDVRLRMAVQQKKRASLTARAHEDAPG